MCMISLSKIEKKMQNIRLIDILQSKIYIALENILPFFRYQKKKKDLKPPQLSTLIDQ